MFPSLTTFINAVKTQTKPESIRRSLSHHKRVLDTGYFWALWHLQNPLEWQNVEHLIHLYVLHLCSAVQCEQLPVRLRADHLFSLSCPGWPKLERVCEIDYRSEWWTSSERVPFYFESLGLFIQCFRLM